MHVSVTSEGGHFIGEMLLNCCAFKKQMARLVAVFFFFFLLQIWFEVGPA